MRFRGRLPYTRSSSSLRSARILLLRSIQSASLSALFRTAAVLLYAASSCARVIPRQVISSITILNRCHHATQQYNRFAPPHCRPQEAGDRGMVATSRARTHLAFTERCALASSSPTVWCYCRHSDLGRAASSIRPDMIFGKDSRPSFQDGGPVLCELTGD